MKTSIIALLSIGLLPLVGAGAQSREPIIDMHLHARRADYVGPDPFPMCAPFSVMPRSDPKDGALAFNQPRVLTPLP